ncbi:MAG: DUF177 domain-containing protein [Methyloprofundus sp.]|nr:DUF177 domain-containing protein [Methyloprofundus sp.]MBW6452270.1 DUF177 domain-containing protein [Methyloprofundus sp.]
MLDQLPEIIDPVVFAERHSHVVGPIGLQRMARLSDFLFDKEGELNVDLQFYKEGKVPVIEGRIEGHVTLICQSCLDALPWIVDKSVKIGMVQTIEQADRLEEGFEPMVVSEQKMPLSAIIEDEVIIALPDYPRHEHSCLQYSSTQPLIDEPEEIKQQSDNPFSVLAKLKFTGDQ